MRRPWSARRHQKQKRQKRMFPESLQREPGPSHQPGSLQGWETTRTCCLTPPTSCYCVRAPQETSTPRWAPGWRGGASPPNPHPCPFCRRRRNTTAGPQLSARHPSSSPPLAPRCSSRLEVIGSRTQNSPGAAPFASPTQPKCSPLQNMGAHSTRALFLALGASAETDVFKVPF